MFLSASNFTNKALKNSSFQDVDVAFKKNKKFSVLHRFLRESVKRLKKAGTRREKEPPSQIERNETLPVNGISKFGDGLRPSI